MRRRERKARRQSYFSRLLRESEIISNDILIAIISKKERERECKISFYIVGKKYMKKKILLKERMREEENCKNSSFLIYILNARKKRRNFSYIHFNMYRN